MTAATHNEKVIIIGAGVAGMATAIRLAVQGCEVHVYEKNDRPGGKLTAFEKDGFHFDAGPSLFTQPANIEALFELAEEPIADHFHYQPVAIACKYFYENGKVVNAFTDAANFAEEMAAQLNEPAEAVTGYLQRSKELYEKIGTIFLDHSLHKRSTWFNKKIIKTLGAVKYGYLFNTLHQHNTSKFASEEAVQLFNRYATYNGSNPYKAPGMLSLIPHLEYGQGVFYPAGGMISITNALYSLAIKKGVQFHFNSVVQNIIYTEGKVKGVVVDNENQEADIVVSNMDVYFTYKNLLNDQAKAKDILKQERSSSALVFYWGIKKQFKELELHNIFFSKNYKEEFDHLFEKKQLYSDPTIYINITAKMEPAHAPAGKENWFVMINAPANTGQDVGLPQQQARQQVIEKLNRMLQTDIEAVIETEEILDPAIIEQKTASFQGSLYGTSSNSKLAAFLRHPNFSGIKNLYCCGGSVHPGGGIPLCLKSAAIVSDLIKKQKRGH
ncbi:1-hydroxycarotenoid 3,4-desaturase CrtD [Ferruginibacter sp.]